ncbi:cyclopropane-fatty-acyl-phospholipid synthase [Erythrobacter sp. NAP1]|uniref:SAM-dependent methyltransferase n=1 Tax=Erythrobacter sp. NAP1 TaxID=237727 RepID=UPI0000686E78|nr:cyclopropane-fatty-acyl-phospholipid synthase family protein [Erythrobacter sp. NAP1]EAQ30364.1 cyclopropane-fatty-acyl-phospholipid synthase [Erythrobacter sp. NAP1]
MSAQGVRGEQLLSSGERFASRPGLFSRLIAPGFGKILDRIDAGLAKGSLLAYLPDGTTRVLGGHAPGFDAQITLKDWRALLRLATGGVIGFYQAYEADEWETPDLTMLFALFSGNVRTLGDTARSSGPFKWAGRMAHWLNRNNRAGSQRNIAAHYDLGNDFYREWLDPTMTYSSALGHGEDGLTAAQKRKHEALSARLGNPKTVLEIGCGWGSLAQHLAVRGADVTAISLSDEQLAYARANTSPDIRYLKQDYRDVRGTFDAIASVEMVEALGREYWPTFMDCIARSLAPGGRAGVQYISLADDLFEAYAGTVDFIQAFIFPGGLLIKSSEFRALAEERGLEWRDQSDFGLDYAETLKIWRARFDAAFEQGRLPAGFDDRFVRLWRFYLSYCEGGFRSGNIDVHQVTLIKT